MQTPEPQEVERLSAVGWIFMVSSLSFVLSMVIFCYRRVLKQPRKDPPPPVKDFHSA